MKRERRRRTRNRRKSVDWVAAGHKSWATRRRVSILARVRAAEAASKSAFTAAFNRKRGWRVAFFEGKTGSPRTGIIDAIAFRIDRKNADLLDLRLVQLKGGKSGISGTEIARLKKAATSVRVNWLIAAFDAKTLHVLPDEPV